MKTWNSSDWIRWVATATSLIAVFGLIVLLTGHSNAEDAPPGFQPGNKPFNNPYAPTATPPPGYFEEDDEEDDFEDDYTPPARTFPKAGAPGSNSRAVTPSYGGSTDDEIPVTSGSGGIQIGNGSSVVQGSRSAKQPHAFVDNEGWQGSNEQITDFNFPDADILDIAKALGKLTGKNFILDKDVKGRISIVANTAVSVKDAWRAFLTALDVNGFALVPSGKFIRIMRSREARDKNVRTFTGNSSPDTDAMITRIFTLKYLSPEDVARNFRSFMPANSRIIPYEQTNSVITTDTGSNIARMAKMIEILDIESYDAGIEVISVKYASASDLSKLIDQLIPGNALNNAAGGPRFPGTGGRFTARKTKEGGIINTIIADERTNNLIVHANSKGADQIRELIVKLDKKLPASVIGGGKIHVIYLQFADAEKIATTINNLVSSSNTAPRPTTGAGSGTGVNPVQANLFEGNIKVAADVATNSLVITATPGDFTTLQRVVNRLDIPRDQVYAEVVILEISLDKNFDFSANILNPTNGIGLMPNGDLAAFIANPLSATGAIIGFKSGGAKTITANGVSTQVSSVQGLIKFLQTNTNANVMATPQILAMDNVDAVFESAEKIPVRQAVATNGAVSQNIATRDVSISIKLKPQINKMSNMVKLVVDAKLEDFSGRALPGTLAEEGFATTSRQAKTEVMVTDGDTIVMGGLTRDSVKEQQKKVPILGDIPILGWLFRSTSNQNFKSNLLIFITPNIIRQTEKVRALLDRKLKERDDFVEKVVGGRDLGKETRDRIIRSLPSVDEIKRNSSSTRSVTIESPPPPKEEDLPNPTNEEIPAARLVPEEPIQKAQAPQNQPAAPPSLDAPDLTPAPPGDGTPYSTPETLPPPPPAG